jgi:hypothetical protein
MFTEAQNFAIVQTELDGVFYQEFNYDDSNPVMTTSRNEMIFKQVSIDRAAYIEEIYKGVGLYSIIGETQSVPTSVPKVANKITTYIKDFAQSVELSKDLFDDNMHGVWARTVADMALKGRVAQDANAFKIFRNATTTTLTADGVALGSASHPLIGGGTTSNLLTSSALSPTTINNAIIKLAEQVDQAGVILGQQPAVLLVPPALIKQALEYTESALIADVATNNINVYRSAYGFRVYASPYLGTAAGGLDTTWFLLGRNHGIKRIIRQGIETALRPWQMSNNRTYLYQANFREEVVAVDYVGVIVATA